MFQRTSFSSAVTDIQSLLGDADPATADLDDATRAWLAHTRQAITAQFGPRTSHPGPRTSPGPRTTPPAMRAVGRSGWIRRTVLAGAGLTVTAAATATAVLLATAGGAAPPVRHAPQPVLLTAATVRQVAAASRSALATSGRVVVAYRTTHDGVPQDSGTDNITFSGKNWNDALSQTFLTAGGQPTHTQSAVNRIVDGQFYLYAAGRTRRLQWYHDTNPSGHPSFTIPDPRTVLRALVPSARFEAAGYQVIAGVRVKELRAASPGQVPGLGVLPDVVRGAHVTSLRVWVDGHSVVRRIGLRFEMISKVYPVSAYNVRHRAHGPFIFTVPNEAMAAHLRAEFKRAPRWERVIIRIAPAGSGVPHRDVQATALTVTFSGVGQPQRITAPRHAIQQYVHG